MSQEHSLRTPVRPPSDASLAPDRPTGARWPVRSWRAWLVTLAVALVTCAVMVGWAVFVDQRVRVHPSGEVSGPWTNPADGVVFTVVKVEHPSTIMQYGEKTSPGPGLSYVVVTYTVQGTLNDSSPCTVNLLGQGQDVWVPSGLVTQEESDLCLDATAQRPARVISVFVVPTARLDQLRGVQLVTVMTVDQPPVLTLPR